MRNHSRCPRYAAAAAALAAGAFVVAAGGASGTPGASSYPSSSMSSSMPSSMSSSVSSSVSSSGSGMAGGSTTVHLYSVQEMSNLYSPDGKVVAHPSTAPTVGSYVVSTDTDYSGNHTAHSSTATGTDHLYCLVTKAPATATCSAEIAYTNGSMLVSDNSTQNLESQQSGATMTFPITGGTGSYAGAHGTVTVTPVANSNNADFTVTYTK